MLGYLLCFLCGQYHVRAQAGEVSKATSVLNPLYVCPSMGSPCEALQVANHARPYATVHVCAVGAKSQEVRSELWD